MSFTYNIDDASPYVSYGPYGDGPSVNNGWRTWYTGSNYATSPEEAAQGVSYHITSSSNATASFQFFGPSRKSFIE
ncbi:hypothetical protein C0991_007541 [Blastosporella zonata]|nr:hypothetical protein C0991_007541 [Blastosporella zonata]